MDEHFKRRFLGEWAIDHEFEVYIKAWEIYFKTFDEVEGDNGLNKPLNLTLRAIAIKEAMKAQNDFLYFKGIDLSLVDHEKWSQAKKEALRRLGK